MAKIMGVTVAVVLGLSGLVQAAPPATQPAGTTNSTAANQEALDAYQKLATAYLGGDLPAVVESFKSISRYTGKLTPEQRRNIEYIRAACQEHRPGWWGNAKSPSNVSFAAQMFGKSMTVNFAPNDFLGGQGTVDFDPRTQRLVNVVIWRPSQVDNPRDAEGWLAQKHKLTKGDIGEVVVWHELGHNFIASALSAREAIEMYRQHHLIYMTLQEFFADLSALYYATPRARLTSLMLRIEGLEDYKELEPHCRGSHAIGAMLLAEFLADPSKWPSVHLPGKIPDKEVELRTIEYVYEHIDPKWTLEEDRRLRDLAINFIRTQGDAVFRSKGMIQLPNRTQFSLMEAQDRENQTQRNQWVTQQLKKAIDTGRADKNPSKPDTGPRGIRSRRIEVPMY